MDVCKTCGDTGFTIFGSYCDCEKGDYAAGMDAGIIRIEEAFEAMDHAEEREKKDKNPLNLKEGEWVISSSIVGTVDEIDGNKLRFIGDHLVSNPNKPYILNAWVPIKGVKRAPVQNFGDVGMDIVSLWMDQEAHMRSIDWALDTRDQDLFLELTGGKPLPW